MDFGGSGTNEIDTEVSDDQACRCLIDVDNADATFSDTWIFAANRRNSQLGCGTAAPHLGDSVRSRPRLNRLP